MATSPRLPGLAAGRTSVEAHFVEPTKLRQWAAIASADHRVRGLRKMLGGVFRLSSFTYDLSPGTQTQESTFAKEIIVLWPLRC
jgi:hypothetical protein